jgi:hypothetical protein
MTDRYLLAILWTAVCLLLVLVNTIRPATTPAAEAISYDEACQEELSELKDRQAAYEFLESAMSDYTRREFLR